VSRTRVVATVGPSTAGEDALAQLITAGVDVFRLNFSHGAREDHGRSIERIRRLAGRRPVAILQDLGGPKLRLAHPVRGRPGDVVELVLPTTVRAGDPVLLADGLMQLEVIDPARSRIVVGGDIPAGKGINLPSSRLDLPSLTPKDREDLRFGVEQGVDVVALSFVRRAADLDETKACGLPVIAKIEKAEAVTHMAEIIAAADGIMVARGDLGVEIPIERVPLVQKKLIRLANRAAKPVITATQMLRSMVDSPMPTRAEATDVANAVVDGTDAVMLSEETAVGRHPVEAVRVMRRILEEAETLPPVHPPEETDDLADELARAACELAARLGARAIVVPTRRGGTARKVARRRPPVPVLALAPDETVRRQLSLVWGVTAVTVPWYGTGEAAALLERVREPLRAEGLVPAGSRIVVTAAWPFDRPGVTNLVHVATL
jgi:pyruvate kinase